MLVYKGWKGLLSGAPLPTMSNKIKHYIGGHIIYYANRDIFESATVVISIVKQGQ